MDTSKTPDENGFLSPTPLRGGDSYIKRRGFSSYLVRVKKVVWYLLGRSASKDPQLERPAASFRVLSRKQLAGDNVLCKNWYLYGEE